VITFDRVSATYAGAAQPTLRDVTLEVAEGELCLVMGSTGTGKSTLLRCVNGIMPTFTGGTLAGRVVVAGRDTRFYPPRELADVVGVVGQDPLAGFVTDTVEEELAYGMEQLGVPPEVMRKRVEETLDVLGLADLRRRALYQLSGGQQQRVAIGSALATHARVLVLDEPTSALASCTTSASPCCSPSTGWNGWCSTPTGRSGFPATAPSMPALPPRS
jgi:energy-coupling factor transport system ATP-binding protein